MKLSVFIVEKMQAMDYVWFMGDNFVASTYREHFLLRKQKSYIKESFEPDVFCNSRFNSSMKNILVRIQNSFASALNKSLWMPKYIIVILDDDLHSYLDCSLPGATEIMASWLSWIMKELKDLILKKKEKLLPKFQRDNEPFIYWSAIPVHANFDMDQNDLYSKYNKCLELLLKEEPSMRMLKFKEVWSFKDHLLVQNGRITNYGLDVYWDAIEASFRFNISRHELFLAKSTVSAANKSSQVVKSVGHLDTHLVKKMESLNSFRSTRISTIGIIGMPKFQLHGKLPAVVINADSCFAVSRDVINFQHLSL